MSADVPARLAHACAADHLLGPVGARVAALIAAVRRDPRLDAPPGARALVGAADPALFLAWSAALWERGWNVFLAHARWGDAERDAARADADPHLEVAADGAVVARTAEPSPHTGLLAVPTGGTGGRVRFAVHTAASLAAAVDGLARRLGGPLHGAAALPLAHVGGWMPVLRAALTGGTCQLASRADELVPDPGALVSVVPAQLARLAAEDALAPWRGWRAVFLGGAAADADLRGVCRALGLPLAPAYGATETGAMVTLLEPGAFLAGGDGVGAALPHAVVEAGGDGRLTVRAASLFSGYWPDVRPCAAWDTGDIGAFDAGGGLRILGRADLVINTGGEKVHPEEVEQALVAAGCAREALVAGVPDPVFGRRVGALLVGAAGGGPEAWRALLAGRLAAYKVPRAWRVVEALPRTAAGKADRVAALELLRGEAG